MPQQSTNLNTDLASIFTSSEYGDRGDGTSKWFQWVRIADTSAGGLLKAEDAPASSGDSGVFMLAVRRDSATSDAAAGDYHALHVDALGRLRVTGTFAEDAAHTSGDEGHFVLGVQSLARTSRSADGDYTPVAVEAAGAVLSATVPEANSAWACSSYNAHAAASGVIKASAGKLYAATIYSEAAQYVALYNTTSVPADGQTPIFAAKLPANGNLTLNFGNLGRYFGTGICWSNSSTYSTKTIGSADCSVIATYL